MRIFKIDAEASTPSAYLHSMDVHVDDGEDKSKYIKKIVLTIEAGQVPHLEVEEYVMTPDFNADISPDQGMLTSTSTHLLKYIELETFSELDIPDGSILDSEQLEMDKLIEEQNLKFISAIDDLEI